MMQGLIRQSTEELINAFRATVQLEARRDELAIMSDRGLDQRQNLLYGPPVS